MIQEIWILEVIIVVLLALPHIKAIVKPIQNLTEPVSADGLAWLPFIALGIAAGIFPAYGFRLECLPILVFALFMSIGSIVSFVTRTFSRTGEFYHNRKPVLSIVALFFLVVVSFPMFAFFPRHKDYTRLLAEDQAAVAEPDMTIKLENSGKNYFLRIYGIGNTTDPANLQSDSEAADNEEVYLPMEAKPLVFLVPPDIGSAASVDLLCAQLLNKGYTVVTYFRKGYDSPLIDDNGRKHPASPVTLLRHWRIFRRAADLTSVNKKGIISETERKVDIEFLLSRLPVLLDNTEYNNTSPLMLVGYGAGGSALAYMAGDDNFSSSYSNVLGVVSIESYLWSSYQNTEETSPEVPDSAGRNRKRTSFFQNFAQGIRRHWRLFTNRLHELKPRRVVRSGPLPGENSSIEIQYRIPVLYLVSGRALMHNQKAQKPYQAVFDAMSAGSGPSALAAIESAGPLDYQDFPFTHPVMSYLLPGLKGAKKSENPVSDTAGVISNFTSYLLEQSGQELTIPPRQTISGNLYTESKGLPAFQL